MCRHDGQRDWTACRWCLDRLAAGVAMGLLALEAGLLLWLVLGR